VKFLVEEFATIVVAEFDDLDELLVFEDLFCVDVVFVSGSVFDEKKLKIVGMILWNCPFVKFIGISSITDFHYLRYMLEVGLKGFVCKDEVLNEIKNAIDMVMKGKYYFSKNISGNLK